jgi:hypothetical protein
MPRASWGSSAPFSSVVSDLSVAGDALHDTNSHQVWRPAPVEEPEDTFPDRGREEQPGKRPALRRDGAGEDADQTSGATRITLRPPDPGTGEEIEKREVDHRGIGTVSLSKLGAVAITTRPRR